MAGGQPRAGLHKARVALGDGHREARADERALARAELDPFTGGQVESGVACIGALGDDRLLVQPRDRQLDQRARRAGSVRASATR